MRPARFAVLLCAALSACASPPPEPSFGDPAGWVREDARGLFSFLRPPALAPREVVGFDSYVGEYRGEGAVLRFDYGAYSDPLRDYGQRGYARRAVSVSGRDAVLARYRLSEDEEGRTWFAGLHVPRVEPTASGAIRRLTLWATCRTEAACDELETALLSVTLPG